MFEIFKPKKPAPSKAVAGKKPAPSRPITVKTPPRLVGEAVPAGQDDELPKPRPMTPERARLIQQALSVHRTAQAKLAELTPEDRQKLLMMFYAGMLKQARGKRDDDLL